MKQLINQYKNNIITIEEIISLLEESNHTTEETKKNGIFYTPKYIADYIVDILKPLSTETIFEPSVGHGIFIFSLIEYIIKNNKLSKEELKKWFLTKVFANDIEQKNISQLKELLVIYFDKLNINISKEELKNITCSDTFNIKKSFDIIYGNPPYIRGKHLEKDVLSKLKKEWLSCEKGNIDIYYAFIEYAHKYSNRSSFIVPNSWLYNSSADNLKKIIKKDLDLIINFKNEKIFDNASLFTSIFYINKKQRNDFISYKEKLNDEFVKFKKEDLKNKWYFNEKEIGNNNIEIYKYHSPIATLRDKIYILNKKSNNLFFNEDIVPFFKISKIKDINGFINNEEFIVFPYKLDKSNKKYKIKEENDLNKDTLIYLNKNKRELLLRDKGNQKNYLKWYSYGRIQGLNSYNKENFLITIPGMISSNYNFFTIPVNILPEEFLFSSGFILEVDKKNELLLLNFLNSSKFRDILKQIGKTWKGKKEEEDYYSLSILQLKEIFKQ